MNILFLQDAASCNSQISLGKVNVSVNPGAVSASGEAVPETILVPQHHFLHKGGHVVKSYVLMLKVLYPTLKDVPQITHNGDLTDSSHTGVYSILHVIFVNLVVHVPAVQHC